MKIKIYVQPNSSLSQVVGMHGDAVKIKIKAPPVDGEANEEIIRFLSDYLKISKKNISLKHGLSGRHKLIEIETDASGEDEIRKKLAING